MVQIPFKSSFCLGHPHKPFFKRLTSCVTVFPNSLVRMHLACNMYSHMLVHLFFFLCAPDEYFLSRSLKLRTYHRSLSSACPLICPVSKCRQEEVLLACGACVQAVGWMQEDPALKPKYMATCYLPQNKVEIYIFFNFCDTLISPRTRQNASDRQRDELHGSIV